MCTLHGNSKTVILYGTKEFTWLLCQTNNHSNGVMQISCVKVNICQSLNHLECGRYFFLIIWPVSFSVPKVHSCIILGGTSPSDPIFPMWLSWDMLATYFVSDLCLVSFICKAVFLRNWHGVKLFASSHVNTMRWTY